MVSSNVIIVMGFWLLCLFVCVIILGIELAKTKAELKKLKGDIQFDWYNMHMKVTGIGIKVDGIDEFLHTVHPDMNKIIMAKYAKSDKNNK